MSLGHSNDTVWNNILNITEFNPLSTYLLTYAVFLWLNYALLYVSTLTTLLTKWFVFKTHIVNSIILAVKFMVLIALFIFIRGGIPRYRYDFLTKMGWIKFLSLVLSLFLLSLLLTYLC